MASEDIDVVVAGAGAAGCAAAVAAAQSGLSVLLLEAKDTFRQASNTALSTSMIPAGGSRWQRERGIDDSPDLFEADIMRKSRGASDPTITRALVQVAPRLVEWLSDTCGVPLELPTDFLYPGHSRHRCHSVADRAGATLHRHLMMAVEGVAQRITLAVPMALQALERADRAWQATVAAPGSASEVVRTQTVVLATGGFGANKALVRQHIPEIADALYFGSDGCQGDGLRIGQAVGADAGYLDAYQGHGSVATPQGVMCTWIAITHGGVILNARGERFADESTGYSEFAREVVAQPEHLAWVVLDRRVDQALRPFADYQQLLAQDGVRWVDDAPALAARVGAPPDQVRATLDQAEQVARGQAADPFGRTAWEAPLESPYGVVKVEGALFHTQGGLLVNADAAVLRAGAPFPGLYAAGGAAAGISGHGAAGYLAGNGLLAALGLGYLAGTAAARVNLNSSSTPDARSSESTASAS